MTGKRRSIEEKVRILRKADGEKTVLQVCDEHNISKQTFYRWKKEIGLLDVKQAICLKELDAENKRLKKIVADQLLGMEILKQGRELPRKPRHTAKRIFDRLKNSLHRQKRHQAERKS